MAPGGPGRTFEGGRSWPAGGGGEAATATAEADGRSGRGAEPRSRSREQVALCEERRDRSRVTAHELRKSFDLTRGEPLSRRVKQGREPRERADSLLDGRVAGQLSKFMLQ